MIDLVWNYGSYGYHNSVVNYKDIHKEKMLTLFELINISIIEEKLTTFECGAWACNVLRECFVSQGIKIDNILLNSMYERDIITFHNYKLKIVSDYNYIPIMFYTTLSKQPNLLQLSIRLNESINQNNYKLALIDAQNIIDTINKEFK